MTYGPNVWNIGENIIVELAIIDPSDGTGLADQEDFITLTIQRVSDFKYWNGSGWSSTITNLSMTQANKTNYPGRYTYTLSGSIGNTKADRYITHANISNPPVIEGDAYEIHVSRQQIIRIYEAEPV